MYFLCCSMYFLLFYVFFVLFYVFLCCSMYFLCCYMYCLFCDVLCIVCVCICVLNYCHRVATQLQLNISYHIIPLALLLFWFPSFWKHSVAIIIIIIISHTAWSHRDGLHAENYAITSGTSCTSFTFIFWKLISTQIKISHEANTAWGRGRGDNDNLTITDYGVMWCHVVWLTDTSISDK